MYQQFYGLTAKPFQLSPDAIPTLVAGIETVRDPEARRKLASSLLKKRAQTLTITLDKDLSKGETYRTGETAVATLEGHGEHDTDAAHEHCALTADRRDAVVALGGTRVSALASNAFERAAPFLERFVPAPARFRIAPKTSPPA